MNSRARWLLTVVVLALGCSEAETESLPSSDGEEGALETEPTEGARTLPIDGAVRAEWRQTTTTSTGGTLVKVLRTAEGAEQVERALAKLKTTDAEPHCDAMASLTHWGGRISPGRTIPKVGESIVFFDADDKRLGTLSLYKCEPTLVTLKRGNRAAVSYRRERGFDSLFDEVTP